MLEELSQDAVLIDLRDIHIRIGMREYLRACELGGREVNEDLRRRLDELDLEQSGGKR